MGETPLSRLEGRETCGSGRGSFLRRHAGCSWRRRRASPGGGFVRVQVEIHRWFPPHKNSGKVYFVRAEGFGRRSDQSSKDEHR